MSNQLESLISQAESWLGYLEKKKGTYTEAQLRNKTHAAGHDNYTIFGKWYGLQGQPYCAMGISMCANDAGIPTTIIPKFADCDTGMAWFKKNKQFESSPKRGDIVFFGVPGDAQHVEIVTGVTANQIKTIGFNTSAGSTMIANGGGVCAKTYNLPYARILGYGRPKYIEEEEMTQAEFNKMLETYFADQAAQKPSDWSSAAREWAESNGYINGDENGNKKYKKFPTREELVQMLYNILGGTK